MWLNFLIFITNIFITNISYLIRKYSFDSLRGVAKLRTLFLNLNGCKNLWFWSTGSLSWSGRCLAPGAWLMQKVSGSYLQIDFVTQCHQCLPTSSVFNDSIVISLIAIMRWTRVLWWIRAAGPGLSYSSAN